MDYLVTILSTSRDAYLERALHSLRYLNPPPTRIHVHRDDKRAGMCAAHAEVWEYAAESGCRWVWHQEEDQVLLRPVQLSRLALLLGVRPHLAQMALVRTPWGAEIEHGGYIPMAPTEYVRRQHPLGEYMETRRNWSTSPMLAETKLMREFRWSTLPNCEGEIGQRILAHRPDAAFGLWGWGEPWCAHIGVERAPGSHGY